MEQPGAKLRLFSTLDDGKRRADAAATAAAAAAAQREAALAAAGRRWGPLFHALTSSLDMPTTALLLQCISSGGSSSGGKGGELLPNFGSAGSSSAAEQAAAEAQLAAAMAARLVPGWWWLTHCVPAWRWQAAAVLESPCFGVPGLCRYAAARAAWVRAQLAAAIQADGCRQVVVLRGALSTLAYALPPAVRVYEVDSRPALARKRALLDEALPPYWRSTPARPRFVEVDLASPAALKMLIPELTAAGFAPADRCCVVAEGVLPYLGTEEAAGLLADLAALAAPGSRLLFDFLHADALDSLATAGTAGSGSAAEAAAPPPGLANLAAAAANKGQPLRSGLKPAFSDMVRMLQRDHLRLQALLAPADVARLLLQQQAAAAAATPPPRGSGGAAPEGKAAGANGASQPAAQQLPYVPEFFSLAAAVKSDPRLLLRHADVAPTATTAGVDSDTLAAGGDASWTGALARPSCLLGGLQWLWCGGSQPAAAAAAAAPTAPPTAAPAAPPELLPAAPPELLAAQLPAASSNAQLRRQPSGWMLAAVLPGTAVASRGGRRSSSGGSGGGSSPHAQATPARLAHAESIAARLPLSSRSSAGSSEGFEQLVQDAGHLLGGGASSPQAAPVRQGAWWQLF